MTEKESAKLEDSLTAMIRITKENDDIDKAKEIDKIRTEATQEIKKIEEIKNSKIEELENELTYLKLLVEEKRKEKLAKEINEMKQILIETENFEINEINENESNKSENSEISDISETYTEILKQTDNLKLEINTNNVNKPGTSRVKTPDHSPAFFGIRAECCDCGSCTELWLSATLAPLNGKGLNVCGSSGSKSANRYSPAFF